MFPLPALVLFRAATEFEKMVGCNFFGGAKRSNRGSYMSAYVLLNLLNKLGKKGWGEKGITLKNRFQFSYRFNTKNDHLSQKIKTHIH